MAVMFTGSWKHLWTSKLPIPILLPNSNKFLLEASKNIEIYIYTYITQCVLKIIGILEDWNWKELETSNSNKKSLEASKNITAYIYYIKISRVITFIKFKKYI